MCSIKFKYKSPIISHIKLDGLIKLSLYCRPIDVFFYHAGMMVSSPSCRSKCQQSRAYKLSQTAEQNIEIKSLQLLCLLITQDQHPSLCIIRWILRKKKQNKNHSDASIGVPVSVFAVYMDWKQRCDI